jgi:hypothetical protein
MIVLYEAQKRKVQIVENNFWEFEKNILKKLLKN